MNKSGPRHSVFPLLPWAGWAFLGGAAGATAARGTAAQVRRLAVGIGIGSVVLWLLRPVWLAHLSAARVLGDRPREHRGAGHLGDGAPARCSWPIEARASAGARRSPAVWLLELFGTSSLAAYFWHEMLIYYEVRGVSLVRVAGGRCGWAGFAGWVAVLVAATALLSWADRQGVPPGRPPRCIPPGACGESGQRLSAAPTAFTTSCSLGKPVSPFSATTFPSTATSKMPPLPATRSASTPSDFLSSAAARVARGR